MPVAIASKSLTDLTPAEVSACAAEAVSIAAFSGSLYLAVCRDVGEEETVAVTYAGVPVAIAQIYRYDDDDRVWQQVEQRYLFPAPVEAPIEPSTEASTCRCQLSTVANDEDTWLLAHFCGFGGQLLWALRDQGDQDAWQEWSSPVAGSALIEAALFSQGKLYLRSIDLETGRMGLFSTEDWLSQKAALSECWQLVAMPGEAGSECSDYSDYGEQGPLITAWVSRSDGIYAAIANPMRGFELWHLAQPSEPWKQVHSGGLQRYSLNAQVTHIVSFQGSLYLTTAQSSDGASTQTIDPIAEQVPEQAQVQFELIRLYNNGDWDLLVGQPRFTPVGLRVPLTCKGPGFDIASGDSAYLAVYQNRLYLGFESIEGFQLWCSSNGEIWTSLSVPELSQYHQLQQFETASTPFGLAMVCDAQTMPGAQSRRLFLYQDLDCS